jgi:hypothetical protein
MVRLLLAYSLVAASTMTAATDGLKHLRTHGHHQGNHGDPSPEEAHQPRAKCTQKLGRRRRYRVVNNPYNESGVTFVASQAVPRRWASAAAAPTPRVANSQRFQRLYCKQNLGNVNWRRVCNFTAEEAGVDRSWWLCEYSQFVLSIRCGYVDSDYRGMTPGMVFDRHRTFPLYAMKSPTLQPMMNPPRRVEHFKELAHNIGVYPTSTAHIIVQLPRLLYLLTAVPTTVPILVASGNPIMDQLLSYLSDAGMLREERIVPWKPDTTYFADTLYVAGEAARGDATGGDWTTLAETEPCSGALGMPRGLLQDFAGRRPPQSTPLGRLARDGRFLRRPHLVVVDRSDAGSRMISNHGELMGALHRAVGKNCTMEVFVGRDHSMAETIAIFSSADMVLGPHGAALSFVSFMQPSHEGSKKAVVEIGYSSTEGMTFPASYYMAIALSVGASYSLSMANGKYNGKLKADIRDVVVVVRSALAELRS